MANGTWDEARRCPKCDLAGEEQRGSTKIVAQPGVTRGARLIQFICRNSRCKWYNTPWEVQVNPDGSIPDPDAPRREKSMPVLTPAQIEQHRQRALEIQRIATQGNR